MARRDGDPAAAEMDRQPRQRPACERDPLAVGTGTGHADDPLTLLSRDPAGTPAPVARAETVHPPLVEVMDDLPHPGRIGTPHLRDLRHRHPHVRRQKHRRPLTRALMLRTTRRPLQPNSLLMLQRPPKPPYAPHHHLHPHNTSPLLPHP